MKRLYLTVEGQTEQAFVREVLKPHLYAFKVYVENPRRTGPHRRKGGRIPQGGLLHTFAHTLADMKHWLQEDRSRDARFSMMVDLHALPRDVPGHAAAMALADPCVRAERLEAALADEIKDQRFIPYIQVHEFEALLLAGPEKLTERFERREKQIAMLLAECNQFASPELINDGHHTHPKARIKKYFADYGETVDGPSLAQAIGLHQIRHKCPHFHRWLTTLENLDCEGAL
jgi:hypothetical protein